MDIFQFWRQLSNQRRDLIKSIAAIVTFGLISASFDLAERFNQWASPLEIYQLDELPLILVAIAISSIWFSRRRIHELNKEVKLRTESENALGELLKENRALAHHIMQIQEEERRYIARELHDDMGQYLTAIRLDAAALNGVSDTNVQTHAQHIIAHAEHIQKALKNLLHRLRHAALETHGLIEAVNDLISEWGKQHTEILCNLSIDKNCENLPHAINIVIYRVIQEALTNIARHAHATKVTISLSLSGKNSSGFVLLQIVDNGVGFDFATSRFGFGLTGMRERIESIGGTLKLMNENGLRISADIPVKF